MNDIVVLEIQKYVRIITEMAEVLFNCTLKRLEKHADFLLKELIKINLILSDQEVEDFNLEMQR